MQHRTWNLSAIWSIPLSSTTVWLKCVPGFFAHEPRVLELLEGHPVPRPLAVDGHRLLLDQLPGVDGYEATFEERCRLIDGLVDIQRWSVGHLDELAAAGSRIDGSPSSSVAPERWSGDEPLMTRCSTSSSTVRPPDSTRSRRAACLTSSCTATPIQGTHDWGRARTRPVVRLG